jgi:hypothetical protein
VENSSWCAGPISFWISERGIVRRMTAVGCSAVIVSAGVSIMVVVGE